MSAKVICADSLVALRRMADLKFDVAVFSPPYGKGAQFLFDVRGTVGVEIDPVVAKLAQEAL